MGSLVASSSAPASAAIVASIPVRLDRGNFMLWEGLTLPNLSGADLHGHLDESVVTPKKTITEGEDDKAVTIPTRYIIAGGSRTRRSSAYYLVRWNQRLHAS
jgi:hypothetical protein